MISKKFVVNFLSILSLLIVLSCSQCCRNPNPCLDVPESDSTYPTAGMFIEFFQGRQSFTKTLSANDASTSINADENRPVTIVYSGQDDEGLKSIHISVTVFKNIGGVQQRQDYTIAPITVSCPKRTLMDTFTLEKDQGNRTARVSSQSTNWLDMSTSTQVHTIIIE
jgi:hypothetical protein